MFTEECIVQTIDQCLAKRVVCICDVILKHSLFKNIKREQTHKLSNIADIIDLEDKQILFFTMQKVDRVYFVLRGQVKLYNSDDNSSKEYIYQLLKQGDSAGLENLYTDLSFYPYAAVATAPSKILTLKAAELKQVIDNDPVIKNNFLEYLSKLSLSLYSRSKHFVLSSVAERLLDYLEYQAALQASREFELSLSKTDLANYLGTISSTLSRAFKELEESSTIEIEKNIVRLP
jgi:CRP/FNR family transcriptional regulator